MMLMGAVSLLSSVLLFVFSIPVVTRYRIFPVAGTPYWLFGFLFFFLLCHLVLSFVSLWGLTGKLPDRMKHILFWMMLVIVLGGTMVTAIVDRSRTAPVYGVHDIILQQEAAMRYLLQGNNPYKETYFGTPVESFRYDEGGRPAVNPALYHFVMPPWYLLFPFGFYFISTPLLGYFDGRMALVVLAFALFFLVFRWFKHREIGLLAVTLLALSPATVDYLIEGRSDVFALFWLVWAFFLLDKKHVFWSGMVYGLALMSKQTIWFSLPFYLAYAWWKTKDRRVAGINILGMLVTTGAVAAPFFLWDANAYLASTVFYLSGTGSNAYPIAGYGWGMVLWGLGFIKDLHAQYPFLLWQVIFGLPALIILLRLLKKRLSLSAVWFGYAAFLFVVWYFSRYFNNSHLGYLSSLFVLAGCFLLDEQGARS